MCAYGNDFWSSAPFQEAPGATGPRRVLSSALAPPLLAPILFRRLPLFQLLGGVVQQLGGIPVAQSSVGPLVRAAVGHLLVDVLHPIGMSIARRGAAPVGLGCGRRCRCRLRGLWHGQIVMGVDALAVAIGLGVSVGQGSVLFLEGEQITHINSISHILVSKMEFSKAIDASKS